MAWALVVESYGKYGNIVPCGNNGTQQLRNKTRRGWLSETEYLRRNTTGTVYVVSDFTQRMCEMSPKQLADYVMRNHIDVL